MNRWLEKTKLRLKFYRVKCELYWVYLMMYRWKVEYWFWECLTSRSKTKKTVIDSKTLQEGESDE